MSNQPLPSPSSPLHALFVWDFDWTVINCNSDEYVPCQFIGDDETRTGFRDLWNAGRDWHSCVEGMVDRARIEGGASAEDILDAARRMPYLAEVRGALDDIRDFTGSDAASLDRVDGIANDDGVPQLKHRPSMGQMILSDGNTLFIQAFLQANGMAGNFTQGVMTNIGTMDGDGKLTVVHQSAQFGGHDCERCKRSPNLCKTQALKAALKKIADGEERSEGERRRRPRIVYVGDGANDACPALNVLEKGDAFLARVGTRRRDANKRKGPETDEEARERDEPDGTKAAALFGIMPTFRKAADDGLVPECRVLEWRTGAELRCLVRKCLDEMADGE